jgi:hypothetical protein
MTGDLIIPSVGTAFVIPGVAASYINIVTLTTKTSCAVRPAMRLCCLHFPLLLREQARGHRFRSPFRRRAQHQRRLQLRRVPLPHRGPDAIA